MGYIQEAMTGLFRLIFYLLIAYLIYWLLRFIFPRHRPKSSHRPPRLSGIMVKDEICNTYLPQEDAIREKVDGKEHFFCSEECRQKFLRQKKSRRDKSSD